MYPSRAALSTCRFRTQRGSPSKGDPSGLWMSQNIRATPSSERHGRIWNVVGSGRATMSDSWMRENPSMEDPSNPSPSVNATSSSCGVMAKDFRKPRTSENHKRMNFTPRSSTVRRTNSASLVSATRRG